MPRAFYVNDTLTLKALDHLHPKLIKVSVYVSYRKTAVLADTSLTTNHAVLLRMVWIICNVINRKNMNIIQMHILISILFISISMKEDIETNQFLLQHDS